MMKATGVWILILVCHCVLPHLPAEEATPPSQPVENALVPQIREDLETVEQLRKESRYDEGLSLALSALRRAEAVQDDRLITESLYQISLIHYFEESHEEARAYMEIGLTHARLHNLENLEADLLNAQGVLEWKQGNLAEASAKLERALEVRQRNRQWVSMASIANNLGIIAYSLQRYAEAVEHYKQGLAWLGDHENDRMRASLFSNLGESLIPLGGYEEAEAYLFKSLEIERRANEPINLAYTYVNLGELRISQGNPEAAVDYYRKALNIQLSIDNEWSSALTRLRLSEAHLDAGQVNMAMEVLEEGYESAKRLNTPILLRDYNKQFAAIHTESGKVELARYHTELEQWFGAKADGNTEQAQEVIAAPAPAATVNADPPKPDFSSIRTASIAILVLLIAVLVIENVRLRKLVPKE